MFLKLIFLLYCIISTKNTFALFDHNKIEISNRPVFKNQTQGIFYLGIGAGFNVYGRENFLSNLNQDIASELKLNTLGSIPHQEYPYLTITAGYNGFNSILRHEINFTYINSNASLSQNILNGISIPNYSFNSVNVEFVRYQISYDLLFHFRNIIDIYDKSIDFFLGPFLGVAINKMSTSISRLYTISETSVEILNNINMDNTAFICGANIGFLINMNDNYAFQIKARHTFITNGLENNINIFNSSKIIGMYTGIEMSLLFKVF